MKAPLLTDRRMLSKPSTRPILINCVLMIINRKVMIIINENQNDYFEKMWEF